MNDKELEKLKAKRLYEMKKNISEKTNEHNTISSKKSITSNKPDPKSILIKSLGYRGLEVLNIAENQFPIETKLIIDKLSELILMGHLTDRIDGGQLLTLFRSMGLNIRMETKINIEKDGQKFSLSDKLKNKE